MTRKMIEGLKNKCGRPEYKSAERSRQLIRQAYLDILNKKDIEKITVTDIVSKADINRSTFYAHYKSPSDVIAQIAQELVDEINLVLKDFNFKSFMNNPAEILLKFCDYLKENKDTHSRLVSLKGVGIFVQKICLMLREFIKNDTSIPQKVKETPMFTAASGFYINAIVYSFRDKIAGITDISYEDLCNLIGNFIKQNTPLIEDYLSEIE